MEGEESVEVFVSEDQGVVDHVDEMEAIEHPEEQLKEEYYDDGVEIEGDDVIELEGDEEPYEIKDEEYVEENTEDLEKEIAITEADKSGEGEKNDGMLVVDEWDNHDVDSLSNDEDQQKTEDGKDLIDPEESEKLLLHMPPLKTIMGDLLHLRRNRRVSMYPVTYADLQLPLVQKYLENDICEEVKMQFVRSSDDIKSWSGFLSFTFVTSKNATQAVESLKSIREDLTVKVDANPDASLDTFIKSGKKTLASPAFWADRLLIVRNISTDSKPEDLRAVFTEAEEIVVAKDATTPTFRKRRPGAFGYAYILYETPEAAKAAASEFAAQQVEFNKVLLDIQLYREPVTEIPRALLYLRRRRLILRHLEKLVRNVEKAQSDPEYKLAPSTESRIALCKTIIEKDDKVRQELKLPAPTYEDFKTIKGFRPYSKQDAERVLISLGIISKPPKPAVDSVAPAGRRDRPSNNRRVQKGRGGQGDIRGGRGEGGRGARGNFRRGGSPLRDRRSPPGNRRRSDWGGAGDRRRGGYNGNRNGNSRQEMHRQPGGGLGMLNPLAMMMQQNLGGLLGASGLNNPAVLNPISMLMQQPGVGNLLGGPGSMMGGGSLEPPPKFMRLDETGNLRVKRDRDEREFGPRDDRGMNRDNRGRQRSRSPDYHMGPMRNQRGGMRVGPPPQRSGFNEMDRLGPPNRSYEPSGSGPPRGGEDDLSLLMNLSKMLSQKMEQKRQQDHGYH